ncbi:signal peptidase II [Paenibacillus whitsoniae]|uniref:Lipoprotein signal peptidase n=1 Tax=Paenibacillus whitsoniae TaxID=2496558 RepID=A0A3S0IA54_9BACL|nr:signal peptidase II [Paenibacillus whitsoniae]RTE08473.1 signal peptidase II [Paenibacillus whitsoniae]
MLFYLISLIVVFIDQLTKIIVRLHVEMDETLTFWGQPITHIENSGMAGSSFQGYARLFGIVAVVFVAIVLYYRRKGSIRGKLNDISLAFLVGGAAGNGIDRLLFGQVTDFLVSRSGKGVLNMADHAIELGILLFVLNAVVQYIKERFYRRCSA